MTTPTHCTRTDPHPAHEVWIDVRPIGYCPGVPLLVAGGAADDTPRSATVTRNRPGVEPPADVAATPNPRLDVVERALAADDVFAKDTAQCVLDALDAMRPDEQTLAQMRANDPNDLRCPTCDHDPTVMCPAPAGLSAAQEIRLRLFETGGWSSDNTIDEWAAWVEHGNDETPDSDRVRELDIQLTRAVASSEALQARADLAEAQLGHIADIVKDRYGMAPGDFADAVRDALAWTPDDTAPAVSRDPNCIAQWPECVSGGYDPRCCRFPKSCSCESWNDTAPADVPERSSRGFCGPTAPAGAATGDGDG